jgi:glycosyltransferase involved in cell wall biosynthesis
MKIVVLLLLTCFLVAAEIPDKILICGICRNIEKAIPNLIASAEDLGSRFVDYRVILYENNSTDRTKVLLKNWAKANPRVLFLSEQISKRRLTYKMSMKVFNRTENLARARNIVLDQALSSHFDAFKYVLWADLDFLERWDTPAIVETILHPQQPWDAIFAYGGYDLFALRSPAYPIGFELLGSLYWDKLNEIRDAFDLDPEGPWEKVYSAFGGLALYKRDAIQGSRYSGVVTKELDQLIQEWLKEARRSGNVCFLKEYEELLSKTSPLLLSGPFLLHRERYPDAIGIKIPKWQTVWFSCTPGTAFPWTCEHIPFHASMILKGHDKLFINPKIRSHHP